MSISCLTGACRWSCDPKITPSVAVWSHRTCLAEGCGEALVLCQCGITDVCISNHHCSTDTPGAPSPAQDTPREDTFGVGRYVLSFSVAGRDVGDMIWALPPWHHSQAIIPPSAFWKFSLIYLNWRSSADGVWVRSVMGTLPSPCRIFSSEDLMSQEIRGEGIWVATSINHGTSPSMFLFVLEKVKSLSCEEGRGQVKQTQVLIVLALTEGQTAHTVSFCPSSNVHMHTVFTSLDKWELSRARHRPSSAGPAWNRRSSSTAERQDTPPYLFKDICLHCTTGQNIQGKRLYTS